MREEPLDHRIDILRDVVTGKDALNKPIKGPVVYARLFASKVDVSDGEQVKAGQAAAVVVSRFQVRWSEKAAGILPTDLVRCNGGRWTIEGLKDLGRGRRIEITGTRPRNPIP